MTSRPLRVGIVNIMPRLESYEPLLVGPFTRVQRPIEPVLIRLATHAYQSSDHAHLDRAYRTFDEVIAAGPLDGLVISGAPVEEMPYGDVHYWPELVKIMAYARQHIPSTLGLCWGGLALAATLKIPKLLYRQKLFGVYTHRILTQSPLLAGQTATFKCAHSRHAGIADWELQAAEADGRVRLLGHSIDAGYTLFETPDHAFVMHLGHPEYVADRLVFEYRRDEALGRSDVPPPRDFDPDHPETSWLSHREQLFDRWTQLLER
ncbi:homoserine O-succinyltransferase [soil metagenome]